MGLFSRKQVAVVVAYRELTRSADPTDHGYAFVWPFGDKPISGTRVVVPGMDGQAFGVVLREATAKELQGVGALKPIKRLVTNDELQKAHAEQVAASDRFWKQAQIAAGLDTGKRASVEEGFPEIYPASGSATAKDADAYGRGWYRIWKRAEEEDRAPEEQSAFRAIAYRWFAIRDKGESA